MVVPGGGEGNSRHALVEPSATNSPSAPDVALKQDEEAAPVRRPEGRHLFVGP